MLENVKKLWQTIKMGEEGGDMKSVKPRTQKEVNLNAYMSVEEEG